MIRQSAYVCVISFLLHSGIAMAETKSASVKPLTVVGTLCPSAKSVLSSQVVGRVEEVYVDVGDSVQKGQPLLELDRELFEIDVSEKKSALDLANVELADSERDLLRMKKLWEKPAGETPSIPQKKYEEAHSRFEKAKALVAQAEADLRRVQNRLNEAVIKSPFDAVITQRFVDPGKTASGPDSAMLEVQAIDPLYLEFSVSQSQSATLSPGRPIAFGMDGSEKMTEAVIDRIYPSLDESTRSVKCRAIIPNAEGRLRPGSLIKIYIE